ncbi:hypothetical protein pipiens_008764, partial [Culex pipiens pipiens]
MIKVPPATCIKSSGSSTLRLLGGLFEAKIVASNKPVDQSGNRRRDRCAPRNFYGRQGVLVADPPQADWQAQTPPGLGKSRAKTVWCARQRCLNPTRKLRHVIQLLEFTHPTTPASFLVRNPVPEFANEALSGTAVFDSVPRAAVVSGRLGPPPLLRPVLRCVFGVVMTESPNSFLTVEFPAKSFRSGALGSRLTSHRSWDWEAAEDALVQLSSWDGFGPDASVVCVLFHPLANEQCSADGPIGPWVDRDPPLC